MEDPIATMEMIEVSASGKRIDLRVEIGRPKYDPRGSWACPILNSTIDLKVRDIHGDDSMQALCLATKFVYSMLQDVIDRGGKLLHPEDDSEVALDATFGVIGQQRD